MNELIVFLKENFNFEIVKRDKTFIVIRCEKSDADRFTEITQKVMSGVTTTSQIKIYKLGMERQYYIYKIHFVLDTSLDSEKFYELYKEQVSEKTSQ